MLLLPIRHSPMAGKSRICLELLYSYGETVQPIHSTTTFRRGLWSARIFFSFEHDSIALTNPKVSNNKQQDDSALQHRVHHCFTQCFGPATRQQNQYQ